MIGSQLLALLILAIYAWFQSTVARSSLELRYEREIGRLDPALVSPDPVPASENALTELRRAIASAERIEHLDERARTLARVPESSWTLADREWIREETNARAAGVEAFCLAGRLPHADFALSNAVLSSAEKLPDDLVAVIRFSRLLRLAALEAAARGDVREGQRLVGCLLRVGRILQGAPVSPYRALGESVERSGLLALHSQIRRLPPSLSADVRQALKQLIGLPPLVQRRELESAFFYRESLATVRYPLVPQDAVRALWIRCELGFLALSSSTFEAALSERAKLKSSRDPRDAVCRPLVDARMDEIVRDVVARRLRLLASAALAARAGEAVDRWIAETDPQATSYLGGPIEVIRLASGALKISDGKLQAPMESVGFADRLREAVEALSTWEVQAIDSP